MKACYTIVIFPHKKINKVINLIIMTILICRK